MSGAKTISKSYLRKVALAFLALAVSFGLFCLLERLAPFEKTPGFRIADIIFPQGTDYNIGVRGFTALGIDFALCVAAVLILWSIFLRKRSEVGK